MLMGQAANEFFHASAPWKQVTVDRGLAASTLAMSVVYIAALAVLLEPFAPTLSSQMLIHFDGYLSAPDRSELYNAKVQVAVDRLASGYRSPVPAKILIPRIDPSAIERWKEELEAKSAPHS